MNILFSPPTQICGKGCKMAEHQYTGVQVCEGPSIRWCAHCCLETPYRNNIVLKLKARLEHSIHKWEEHSWCIQISLGHQCHLVLVRSAMHPSCAGSIMDLTELSDAESCTSGIVSTNQASYQSYFRVIKRLNKTQPRLQEKGICWREEGLVTLVGRWLWQKARCTILFSVPDMSVSLPGINDCCVRQKVTWGDLNLLAWDGFKVPALFRLFSGRQIHALN